MAKSSNQISILHVTEAFGGGVESAINSYVASTPNFSHSLLFCNARSESKGVEDLHAEKFSNFKSVFNLTKNPLLASGQILQVAKELKVDVVHLHSSFAGVYGRSISNHLHRLNIRVIYTPHCFAFERKDINPLIKLLFLLIEKYYARKMNSNDYFAACSLREEELSKKLNSKTNSVFIPNIPSISLNLLSKKKSSKKQNKISIISLGRICKQKNAQTFINIAKMLKSQENIGDYEFIWIGKDSNNVEIESQFAQLGIDHIKWMSKVELKNFLTAKSNPLLLHTALWEGFPVALLDASSFSIPIIALKQDYFYGVINSPLCLFGTENEAVSMIENLRNPKTRAENISLWKSAFKNNNKANQSKKLSRIYSKN